MDSRVLGGGVPRRPHFAPECVLLGHQQRLLRPHAYKAHGDRRMVLWQRPSPSGVFDDAVGTGSQLGNSLGGHAFIPAGPRVTS